MAVKFLSDGHFSGSSTDLTLDGQLFLPSFSNTPGASPTISFDSGSGGISYRNGGGSSDQLWFRAGGSNMAYINSAGIHSSGNLYSANAGDFRNYGGEWHATTGITGNGFKFTNTADSIDALTLSATGNATFAGNINFGDSHFIGDDADDNLLIQGSASENVIVRSEDGLYFRTGGNNTRLTINSSGDATFVGDITLDDNSGASPSLYLKNGNNNFWRIFCGSSEDLTFRLGTVTKLEIDSSGNADFTGSVTVSGDQFTLGSGVYETVIFDSSPSSIIGNGTMEVQPTTAPGSGTANFTTYFKDKTSGGVTKHHIKVDGDVTANSFVKSGGTSSQFLMSDGSVSTGGSGISQSDADTRYVNVTGDTMTGNLTIQNGSPILTLKDTTDDDDQQINFQNNGGTIEYVIRTRDFTTAATGDGMFIGSISNDPLALVTNNTTALTINTSQDVTFSGLISQTDTQGDNSFAGNILLQNAGSPQLRIYKTSGANTKYGVTSSNIGEIGTTSNHSFRLIQNGTAALTIDTSKNATFAADLTVTGGDITLGGTGRIQGIDTVSAGTDAVNKNYVDNAISGITEQDTLDTVTDRGAITSNDIQTGNIDANGSILGNGNLFLRSYNNDPKGIFFRDGFEYGDTNQYNLSITVYDDGDSSADAMNINAYDGIYFNVQSGTTPSTAFRVLNGEVRSYKTLIADSSFQMNQSNTQVTMSGNTSGNFTIDNNTGSIAFQANGSTVNSMTITSSAITLNENTTATGTFDPQGNILGAVIDDGNTANPLQVRRSAATTNQVGINFTVSLASGSGFSRYLGVDSSADLRFGSSTNHGTNALVLTTANYTSQFGSFAGDIIPSADSTYDLGSNAKKWAEGHFDHLYVGETGNNPRIDIYTESSNSPIADTFAQDTQKSYIYFNAGSGSNDPGFIMHETSGFPEDNEGVLHLVPSDDNSTGDYVSIHGTNDPDCIKLHTSGLIETANYQLQLRSAVGDVYIDDGLSVNGTIAATGGTSTTWNEAHDNMIISASVSGTSTKTITLNQNDGGTITASWSDLQGTTVSAPNAPTNLSLSIVNNTVNVTFDASSTSGIDQYLVFGSANGGDYSLISVIEPASMGSTMSVIDDSFDDSGAQAYRVYAMKTGVMSSALSGSITYTVSTPVEPTNMSVVNLNTAFYIQWDPPSSNARFVTAYNVYKHEHATQGSLSRLSATLIYSGMNTSYMYEISGNNNLKYHQFWVETTVT